MRRTLDIDTLNSVVKFIHGLNALSAQHHIVIDGPELRLYLDHEGIPFQLAFGDDSYVAVVVSE